MDTELLVENRIDDGQKLLAELITDGFDVSVAFWVKTTEDGLWFLYIGSTDVEPTRIGDAYRTLYACLSRLPDPWVSMSEVKLIPANNPIARDAVNARDRHPGRLPIRFHGKRLGNLSVEEAYIYPRVGGQMTLQEILQTLFGMANRPAAGPARPSRIRLRDGSAVNAIITSFNFLMPAELTLNTLDPTTNAIRQISGDDILRIE